MKNKKKMILPGIFALIVIICLIGYALMYIFVPIPFFIKIITTVVLLGLIGAMIAVYIQRLKEFKEEEKDDISKY